MTRRKRRCLDPLLDPVFDEIAAREARRLRVTTAETIPPVYLDGRVMEPIDDYASTTGGWR